MDKEFEIPIDDDFDIDQITDLLFCPDMYGSVVAPVCSIETACLPASTYYSHEYIAKYKDNKQKTILILNETYHGDVMPQTTKAVMHFWKIDIEKLSIYNKLKLMLLGLDYIENYQIRNEFDSMIVADYIDLFKYINEDFEDDIFNSFYIDLSEIVKTDSLEQREILIEKLRNKIKDFINGEKKYQDEDNKVSNPSKNVKTDSLMKQESLIKKLHNKIKEIVNGEKRYKDQDSEISKTSVSKK